MPVSLKMRATKGIVLQHASVSLTTGRSPDEASAIVEDVVENVKEHTTLAINKVMSNKFIELTVAGLKLLNDATNGSYLILNAAVQVRQ